MIFFKKSNFWAVAVAPFVITSCGKEMAQDPPRSENKLVVELFKSLEQSDHESTIKKVERLKALEPSNIFLQRLEKSEKLNSILIKLKKYLACNEYIIALEYVDKEVKLNPDLKELKTLKEEVKTIASINSLIDKLNQEDALKSREKILTRLASISKRVKNEKLNLYILNKQKAMQNELMMTNQKLEQLDLILDIDEKFMTGDASCWNDLAELAIENPEATAVKHYLKIISGVKEPEPYLLPIK